MSRSRRYAPTLVVVLSMLAIGCGRVGGMDSADEAASIEDGASTAAMDLDGESYEEEPDGGAVASGGQSGPARNTALGAGVEGAALQPADLGRDLVYTATSRVVVDDVSASALVAQQTVAAAGGLLFGQETTTDPIQRTVLVFKVPPSAFGETLGRLGEVGDLVDQRVSTDDVTERLVNLESQIRTAEVSVERLRGFLSDADSVATVATLEGELLERERELELLRGQERTLRNQVSLATITLTLEQRVYRSSLQITQTVYQGHDGGSGCPGRRSVELGGPGEVTVCYMVLNDGDRVIGELTVRDEELENEDDVVLVSGATTLAPGEQAVFAFDLEAREDVWLSGSVRGKGPDGEPASARAEQYWLAVPPDDAAPGFAESVGRGVAVLQALVSIVVVVAGVALPLLWIPLLAGLGWVWVRRRRASSASDSTEPVAEDSQ